MPDSRWEAAEALFIAAADLDAAAREAMLADACRDDPALRAEVEALLRADSAGLDSVAGVVAHAAEDLAAHVAASRIGERVGAYRLVELLGHGGMGTVYLAERADDEYRARVAIKFVRGAHAAPELIRRFRAERQILADLDHPNIARLIDGGTTTDGTPYLVLEYVEGEHIDRWCDARGLDVRERVRLFIDVCRAVEYAHGRHVVHRDLKPSNIIVAQNGTPKLVDFGIARILDRNAGDMTTTLRVMTPAYASPEQVAGEPVSPASDVYSLGAVLFALISGRPPIDVSGVSSAEVERRLKTRSPQTLSIAAADRGDEWQHQISAVLDDAVARALRKHAQHRYPTVAALAADLRAFAETPHRRAPVRAAWMRVRSRAAYRNTALASLAGIALAAAAVGAWRSDRAARIEFTLLPGLQIPGVRPGVQPIAADVNGDGRADLMWNERDSTANRVIVGLGRADGTVDLQPAVMHPAAPAAGWHTYTLLAGDFNGDGRADLGWNSISGDNPNHIYVAASREAGFQFLGSSDFGPGRWASAWTASVGDIDGDGSDDIVFNVLGTPNHITVARSNGDGTFAFTERITHPATRWQGYRRFIADVDGDGRIDVIWNDVPVWANRTYVARSQGDRLDLLSHQDHPVGKGWQGYTTLVGDVNRDQRADLVWIKAHADSIHVYSALGDATGRFVHQQRASAAVEPGPLRAASNPTAAFHAGDFNGDGRTDVLLHAGGQFKPFRATRSGFAFDGAWRPGLPGITTVADIDGDARDDVLWMGDDGKLYVAVARSSS